jgi:hypothetical protein
MEGCFVFLLRENRKQHSSSNDAPKLLVFSRKKNLVQNALWLPEQFEKGRRSPLVYTQQ